MSFKTGELIKEIESMKGVFEENLSGSTKIISRRNFFRDFVEAVRISASRMNSEVGLEFKENYDFIETSI